MPKNQVINIAIIGCGRISKNHIKSIILCYKNAQLVATCDISEDNLKNAECIFKEFATEINIELNEPIKYNSYEKLLEDANSKKINLDLIILATPSGLHATQVEKAANAGIHICTEKPMATTWSDGLKMVKACEMNKVKLFVVKQNRFTEILQHTKKQIDKGRFGKLSLVNVNVFWQRPQKYYDEENWRGTAKYDGGALMNQASHYVDLITWLIGPVKNISASLATIGRKIEVEDTAAIQIKFINGALGTMAVTMLTFPRNLEASITILGENGSVKIGGKTANEIQHWEFADQHDDDFMIEELNNRSMKNVKIGHLPFYENMLDAIRGKAYPICDGNEGLKSLEFIIAAYKSSNESNIVHLPLEN